MNAFQKLRQVIDKNSLNYQFGDTMSNSVPESCRQTIVVKQQHQHQQEKRQKQRLQQWQSKQQQLLTQIKNQANKIQALTKSLKLCQIKNCQLINQICQLQKNNQLLKDRSNDHNYKIENYQDKQKKYKQQIARVNKALQQIGCQLNNQRIAKKNLNNQIIMLKQQYKKLDQQYHQKIKQYQCKIYGLKQQSTQRSKMLEFNIKHNSQQRKQYRCQIDKIKQISQKSIQNYKKQLQKTKNQLYQIKSNLQLESHKNKSTQGLYNQLLQRYKSVTYQIKIKQQALVVKTRQLLKLQDLLAKLTKNIQILQNQLMFQRQNTKIKVVEVKDSSLQLELEMYKRQTKQLLQQKAIMCSIRNSRTLNEPSYQIVDRNKIFSQYQKRCL